MMVLTMLTICLLTYLSLIFALTTQIENGFSQHLMAFT